MQGKEPIFYSDTTQFRIILPNLNYKNVFVDRLMDGEGNSRIYDGVQDRVHDGVQDGVQDRGHDYNKIINDIIGDVIGQATTLELLEYCKLPRTRIEIQEFCGLLARRNFSTRYLKPLLEKGLLKMTLPDKPKSKKQRYYSEL